MGRAGYICSIRCVSHYCSSYLLLAIARVVSIIQGIDKSLNVCMTVAALLCHCFEDGYLNVQRKLCIELCRRDGLICQMPEAQRKEIRGHEWCLPCEKFISNTSQGILVSL